MNCGSSSLSVIAQGFRPPVDRFRTAAGECLSDKIAGGMGVTSELQNLGDAQLCRDITAHLEHAFSERQGQWRVSIAGSRAAENWELRVEGPNGFERSYTLSAAAGEHEPAAIRTLVLRLVPSART
jgi:hypothetical protein